jgi:glycosyltransferase involved in cell wall biosynthesis
MTAATAVIAAKLNRRPCLLSPHESLTDFDVAKSRPPIRNVKQILRSGYSRSVDLFVFSSALERSDSVRVRWDRGVVIYHPVYDEQCPHEGGRAGRHRDLRVGFLGRLDAKKNVDLLLQALVRLPTHVRLSIAGAGPEESNLRKLAYDLEVEDRVEWLGFVTEEAKAVFFDSIDLLVLPSAYECFGMAAAEAMTQRVPVIVARSTGIAEIVESAGGGVVVPPTASRLVDEIVKLSRAGNELARLSAEALAAARQELSYNTHGRRLREAYERFVTSRSARPCAS